MLSLNARLLIAATLVLTTFLGLTGVTLDRAYRQTVESAIRDRLESQFYALVASTDVDADGALAIPANLPDSRLSTPVSGVYASVRAHDGTWSWTSLSSQGVDIPYPTGLRRGESAFDLVTSANGEHYFVFSFGLAWGAPGGERGYTFNVAESSESFSSQVAAFRARLLGWLGGSALVFILVQGLLLHWSLRPLRRAAEALSDIEQGRSQRLEGVYPRELRALTDNLNALLRFSQRQLERSRNALADLAHSLKTPLTVLQSSLERGTNSPASRDDALEQVRRVAQLVEYQLQRAATSGRTILMGPVSVVGSVKRISETLAKVYAEKPVRFEARVASGLVFHGDEGDLLELLGNLLDNAYKWARGVVRISAHGTAPASAEHPGIRLTIEDDGPGISELHAAAVRTRGVRADTSAGGQGIGLAIVDDIVAAYQGRLSIGRSSLGGASVVVELPGTTV